ncbi:MAG: hypothetical protein AAF735_07515 [Myxococcota bacterium]
MRLDTEATELNRRIIVAFLLLLGANCVPHVPPPVAFYMRAIATQEREVFAVDVSEGKTDSAVADASKAESQGSKASNGDPLLDREESIVAVLPNEEELAPEYIESIEGFLVNVVAHREEAREERDEVKLNCVNEKVTAITGLLQTAEQAHVSLRDATFRRDRDAAAYEYKRIAIADRKAARLHAESEACVGELAVYSGDTSTEVAVSQQYVRYASRIDAALDRLPEQHQKALTRASHWEEHVLPGTKNLRVSSVQHRLVNIVGRLSKEHGWGGRIVLEIPGLVSYQTGRRPGALRGWLFWKTQYVQRATYEFAVIRDEKNQNAHLAVAVLHEEMQADYQKDDWRICNCQAAIADTQQQIDAILGEFRRYP